MEWKISLPSNNFFFLATNDNKILDRFKFLTLRNFIITIYRNFKYKNDIKKNNTAELNLIIDILNKDIKSYNGKLYFVYLPKFSRYDTTSTDLNNELIFKKNLNPFFQKSYEEKTFNFLLNLMKNTRFNEISDLLRTFNGKKNCPN